MNVFRSLTIILLGCMLFISSTSLQAKEEKEFDYAFKTSKNSIVLDIPYVAQISPENSWAACVLMLAMSVNPDADNNILSILYDTRIFDNINPVTIESNRQFVSAIQRRAQAAPIIKRWNGYKKEKIAIANYISDQISLHKKPVMVCTATDKDINESPDTKCVVVSGVEHRKYLYVLDPNPVRMKTIPLTGNIDYVFQTLNLENQKNPKVNVITVIIPKELAEDRPLLTFGITNNLFNFSTDKDNTAKDQIFFQFNPKHSESVDFVSSQKGILDKQVIPEEYKYLNINGSAIRVFNASNDKHTVKVEFETGIKDGTKLGPKAFPAIPILAHKSVQLPELSHFDFYLNDLRKYKVMPDYYLKALFYDENNKLIDELNFNYKIKAFSTMLSIEMTKNTLDIKLKDKKYPLTINLDTVPYANVNYSCKGKTCLFTASKPDVPNFKLLDFTWVVKNEKYGFNEEEIIHKNTNFEFTFPQDGKYSVRVIGYYNDDKGKHIIATKEVEVNIKSIDN